MEEREKYQIRKQQTDRLVMYLLARALRWRGVDVKVNAFGVIRAEECESIAAYLSQQATDTLQSAAPAGRDEA